MRFYALTSLVAACLFSGSAFAQSPVSARLNPTADFAFINGKIYTMDPENPTAEAITIEGDMITYVGTASGLPSKIGLGTEVIDLEGKMVLPGFVDGHTHALVGGIINTGVDLQTDDLDVLFERIRKYVAENRGHEVIRGYGVRFNPWTDGWPTAAMLDEIEAERPIFLFAIDGHKAWVNSRALEIAGIDKDTPDTVPGYSYFERDAEGNPTGWIVESAAFMQVLSALLDLDKNAISAGAAAWAQRFSAAGITAVHDYGFTGIGEETGFEIMQGLESSGDLSYRLQGVFYWNDPSIDPVSKILDLRSKYDSDLVSAGAIKINLDGGDDSWNALFTEPYSDRPEIKVSPIIPYDILNDVVQRADAAGVNVVCHCFGDLAVRKFLDSIELAIKANPDRDRRNVASHALLVHPNDIPRFAKLGVTYDTTGSWMTFDPLLQTVSTERLGAERVKAMFPVNRIAKAGGNFSFGSDWPVSGYVSEYRPLAAIERGVTRQMKGREDVAPLGGEEAKIPLQLALEAHTINAAYGMNMSDEIGSLEVGKKADLVVLGKDLYEIEPSEISEVEVLYTVMGGSLTHDHTKEAAE